MYPVLLNFRIKPLLSAGLTRKIPIKHIDISVIVRRQIENMFNGQQCFLQGNGFLQVVTPFISYLPPPVVDLSLVQTK